MKLLFSSGGLKLYLKLYKYLSHVGWVVQPDSEWSVNDVGLNLSSSFLFDFPFDCNGFSKTFISWSSAASWIIWRPWPNQFPSDRIVFSFAINTISYFLPYASIVARHESLLYYLHRNLWLLNQIQFSPMCIHLFLLKVIFLGKGSGFTGSGFSNKHLKYPPPKWKSPYFNREV